MNEMPEDRILFYLDGKWYDRNISTIDKANSTTNDIAKRLMRDLSEYYLLLLYLPLSFKSLSSFIQCL